MPLDGNILKGLRCLCVCVLVDLHKRHASVASVCYEMHFIEFNAINFRDSLSLFSIPQTIKFDKVDIDILPSNETTPSFA
jgi:hypothetical protein